MSDIFKYGSRQIRFRYDIIRGNVKIGEASVISCKIFYNSDAAIKRTATFEMLPGNIDFVKDQIRVYMITNTEEKVIGTFLLASPNNRVSSTTRTCSVEAYDRCLILKEDCFTERTYFRAGDRYDIVISSIVASAGISTFVIPQIPAVLPAAREFEIGVAKLDAINELLDEINYNPIVADEHGEFVISEYIQPSLRTATVKYFDDKFSVITPDYESEADIFGIPNVFIARCDNPELEQEYYSVYVNDNPGSKLSTVYRGRRVVSDIYMPDYIESQQALDEYIKRKAVEESMIFDNVKIKTALSAEHGYRNIVRIRNGYLDGVYIEKSWEMELKAGALMVHNLVGVFEL